MEKVLVVGTNPSIRSPDLTPFHPDTKSSRIINFWFRDINAEIVYVNIIDYKKPDNRPLTTREIKEAVPGLIKKIQSHECKKIVGLGKSVAKALTLAGYEFFEAPHPSGLNRKLNNKRYVNSMMEQLKKYCEESNE